MIFVDTGVWFEAFLPSAPQHDVCASLIAGSEAELVTTDYVIDELVTLLIARHERKVAAIYVPQLLDGSLCRLHHVTETDFTDAWRLIQRFADKRWSFTDCTSYAVMQRLRITDALALDDHFRQFGFCEVRP